MSHLLMWGAALLYNLMLAEARLSAAAGDTDSAQRLAADYRAALEGWHSILLGRRTSRRTDSGGG